MCLLLLAFDVVPGRPWLLLGNRDEFHARPAVAAHAWADAAGVVGGRDLQAGGTWLALNRNGRFAAVTNVRTGNAATAARSRGELVVQFLAGAQAPLDYAAGVAASRDQFGPFNLIVGDRASAAGASSTRGQAWRFASGVHVLSNGPPGADWPKVRRLDAAFSTMLQKNGDSGPRAAAWVEDAELLDLLADTTGAADAELPNTGVGLELERRLAPMFIRGERYGTRASTLAYARHDGACVVVERGFGPDGASLGEVRIEMQAG